MNKMSKLVMVSLFAMTLTAAGPRLAKANTEMCSTTATHEVFEAWFGAAPTPPSNLALNTYKTKDSALSAMGLVELKAKQLGYTAILVRAATYSKYGDDSYNACITVDEIRPLIDNSAEGLMLQLKKNIDQVKEIVEKMRKQGSMGRLMLTEVKSSLQDIVETLSIDEVKRAGQVEATKAAMQTMAEDLPKQ